MNERSGRNVVQYESFAMLNIQCAIERLRKGSYSSEGYEGKDSTEYSTVIGGLWCAYSACPISPFFAAKPAKEVAN